MGDRRATGPGDSLDAFRRNYAPPFLAYLTRQDEAGLRNAYELGRQAMSRDVGILGLVDVHNSTLLEVLATARTASAAYDVALAASTFLVEALSSFEMTQRGFLDSTAQAGESHEPPSS